MRRAVTLAALAIAASALLGCSWVDLYTQFLGSPDTRYLSCAGIVYDEVQQVFEEMWDPAEREDVHEMCYKLPDWTARVEELKTTHDGCPDPTDPQLVRIQAQSNEMYDELHLAMTMLVHCCDDEADCDLQAIEAHWNRVEELSDLVWREWQEYGDSL